LILSDLQQIFEQFKNVPCLWFSLKGSCRFVEIWLRIIESNLILKMFRIPGHKHIKNHDTANYLAKNALSKDFCNNIVCHTLLDVFDWFFFYHSQVEQQHTISYNWRCLSQIIPQNGKPYSFPCSLWLKINLFAVRTTRILLIWVGVGVDFHAEKDVQTCTQILLIFRICAYINRSISPRKSCMEVLHGSPAWKSCLQIQHKNPAWNACMQICM